MVIIVVFMEDRNGGLNRGDIDSESLKLEVQVTSNSLWRSSPGRPRLHLDSRYLSHRKVHRLCIYTSN